MLQRYSFLCTFALLFSGLHWWVKTSESVLSANGTIATQTAGVETGASSSDRDLARRELLEVLDRFVVHQRYYHSVYGHYTKVLSRVGFSIPHRVSRQYEIRVVEANPSQLLVTAFSEENGRTGDLASIDQSFRLQANFSVPSPRAEYLKIHAYKHLRMMRESAPGQAVEEEGIYTGYFRYEVRQDSKSQLFAFAIGVKSPVIGVELESGPSSDRQGLAVDDSEAHLQLLTSLMSSASEGSRPATGETADGAVMTSTEEAYLAQKIFQGEMGRYARNWSELAQITHFRFDRSEGAPDVQAERLPATDRHVSHLSQGGRGSQEESHRLIIESVEPVESDALTESANSAESASR